MTELAHRLLDERTRLAALRELLRRKGQEDLEDIRHPELVVCRQGPGEAPLYLVLAEFLPPNQARGPFGEGDFDALFPEEQPAPRDPLALRNELLIVLVSPDGEILEPFGGDNVLNDGIVADVNGDGRVERVDQSPYSVDGVKDVNVLRVWPVERHSGPALAVLYNWGGDEWGFRLTDADHDGRVEFELGPRQVEGIRAKVAFAWDASRKAYLSPSGTAGAHFRVLEAGDIWPQFARLKADGLQFAADPESVPEEEREPRRSFGRPERRLEARSEPYVYRSLRSLDADALIRYMGAGPQAGALPPDQGAVPADLWNLPPASAAAKYLDANRPPGHRAAYRIAFDDMDGAAPPESGSVAYYVSSAPCYQATTSVWFLSAVPGSSYLAFGSSSRAGTVYFDFVRTQPTFEVKLAPVPDAVARQVLQTIWWLSRARSKPRGDSGMAFAMLGSTADGSGRLTVRSASGRTLADAQGTDWSGTFGDRWAGDYDEDVFLNFAAQVVETALPDRLGGEWRDAASARHDPEEILRRYEPDGSGVPPALAALSVGALAERGLKCRLEALRRLLARLPGRDPALPDERAAEGRLSSLNPVGRGDDRGKHSPDEWRDAMREADRLRLGSDDAAGRELLRKALELAIRQLRSWDDVGALERWADDGGDGWRFALSRLRELDERAYVRALEAWLARSEGEDRRQVFSALKEAAPERVHELAREPNGERDLAVASFDVLARAKAIPDEDRRVAALVAIVIDAGADWAERIRAIAALVPEKEPLRFEHKAIDDALLARLGPGRGPDDAFVKGPAAAALARRGRVEAFDPLLEAWTADAADTMAFTEASSLLSALVQLAPRADERHRRLLVDAFRARLRQTNGLVFELVLAIWASDLRELLPDLERVATSSPEDVEGEAADSWRSGDPRLVTDRFHAARKVAALWNEEDAATRARLLLAFGRFEPVLSTPERETRIKESLAAAATGLARADRERLRGFLERLEADGARDPDRYEHTSEFFGLVRSTFGWPIR